MQISPIQQNNTSFKAYIKPNANFHILYGKPPKKDNIFGIMNPVLVKQLSELPNHCIEILKINELKSKTKCIILNQATNRAVNLELENKEPIINQLMKSIIDLKDDKFFKHKILRHEEFLYKTLTTGEPIREADSRIIDKISKLELE